MGMVELPVASLSAARFFDAVSDDDCGVPAAARLGPGELILLKCRRGLKPLEDSPQEFCLADLDLVCDFSQRVELRKMCVVTGRQQSNVVGLSRCCSSIKSESAKS